MGGGLFHTDYNAECKRTLMKKYKKNIKKKIIIMASDLTAHTNGESRSFSICN